MGGRLARAPMWLARATVALALLVVLVRLPTLTSDLRSTARANDARDAHSRFLAAADSLDIDNDFVTTANEIVPDGASFAVLLPHWPDPAIPSFVTYGSVAGYMQYILLPRREVQLSKAKYVLCYACHPGALHRKVKWVWSKGKLLIGKVAAR